MKFIKNLFISSICILFVTLLSCNQLLAPSSNDTKSNTGMGKVRLSFSIPARTIYPEALPQFTRYKLEFDGPADMEDMFLTTSPAEFEMYQGEGWTVEVTAYTGTEEAYIPVAFGTSTEFEVDEYDWTPLDITVRLMPYTEGEGSFAYNIIVPTGASGTLSINTLAGVEIEEVELAAGTTNDTISLTAGQYLINAELEMSGRHAGKTEVVHIYSGFTSTAKFRFIESSFGFYDTLSAEEWFDNDMIGVPQYYRITGALANTTYALQAQTSYGSSNQSADSSYTIEYLNVSVYWEEGETSILTTTEIQDKYITPLTFNTDANSGNIIVKIEQAWSYTGNYSLRYYTPDSLAPMGGIVMDALYTNNPWQTPKLNFTWAASTDVLGYRLYRSTNPDTDYVQIGSDLANSLSQYEDTDVVAGTRYYYKLAAFNGNGEGEKSSVLTMLPPVGVPLPHNTWVDGEMIDEDQWYRISVEEGSVGELNWKDVGDDLYTASIWVDAYQEDGTAFFTSSTTTGKTLISTGDIIYIKFGLYSPGSYSIKYDSVDNITELDIAEWKNATLGSESEIDWYKFTADADTTYNMQLNNYAEGNDTMSIATEISAYKADGTTLFASVDEAYYRPQIISGVTGTVYIKLAFSIGYGNPVFPGTYALRYYNPAIIPPQYPMYVTAVGNSPWETPFVNLNWPNADTATSYTLYRTTDSDAEDDEYTQIADGLSWSDYVDDYTDTDVVAGTTYYYKVAAVNSYGSGAMSSIAAALPVSDSTIASLSASSTWTQAEISYEGEVDWYKITPVSGSLYEFYLNDQYAYFEESEYGKTLYDPVYTSYKSNGTEMYSIDRHDQRGPMVLLSNTDTIYLKVEGAGIWDFDNTGTYSLRYEEVNATQLSSGVLQDDIINGSTLPKWYSFDTTAGSIYKMSWSGMYTIDFYNPTAGIMGRTGTGTESNPTTILGHGNTVFIRCTVSSLDTDISIKYESAPSVTSLDGEHGEWYNSYAHEYHDWYSFTALAGQSYNIYTDQLTWYDQPTNPSDSGSGQFGSNAAQIMLGVFRSDGTIIYSTSAGLYTTPYTLTGEEGTIYLMVTERMNRVLDSYNGKSYSIKWQQQ
jgi:hypothetical protein